MVKSKMSKENEVKKEGRREGGSKRNIRKREGRKVGQMSNKIIQIK